MINFRLFPTILLTALSVVCVPICRADLPILTVLHTFTPEARSGLALSKDTGADAGRPEGPLIQGLDGAFYGIMPSGGIHGTGIVFRINGDGTGFILLHSFGPLDMLSSNQDNADGGNPKGALVSGRNSALYGACEFGGPDGAGTVFRMNQDGSGFKLLHSFEATRHSDGEVYPKGVTLDSTGMLYGTTLSGGKGGHGVLFRISQGGEQFQVMHSFRLVSHASNSEGIGLNPSTGVVIGQDGSCYGTTSGGGKQGCGEVYKIDAAGNCSVLYSFQGRNKDNQSSSVFAQGPLIIGPDSFLYGCTRRGGTNNGGTVYKISTDGTGFAILHNFSAPDSENEDGTLPDGPLVFGRDGYLYSVTSRGGSGEDGVLFRLSRDGAKFFALHDFQMPDHNLCNADGGLSFMGLTLGRDGNLYGVSAGGGANGTGTIFRVTFPAVK